MKEKLKEMGKCMMASEEEWEKIRLGNKLTLLSIIPYIH